MSKKISRYNISGCVGHCYGGYSMDESEDGDYVKSHDYDKLLAEAEKLQVRMAQLMGHCDWLASMVEDWTDYELSKHSSVLNNDSFN